MKHTCLNVSIAVTLCGCTCVTSSHNTSNRWNGVYMSERLEGVMRQSLSASTVVGDTIYNPDIDYPLVYDYEIRHPTEPAPAEVANMVLTKCTLKSVIALRYAKAHIVSDPWGEVLYITNDKRRAERASKLGNELQKYRFSQSQIEYHKKKKRDGCNGWYACYLNMPVNDAINEIRGTGACAIDIVSHVPNTVAIGELELWYRVPVSTALWIICVVSDVDIEVNHGKIEVYEDK